MLSEDDQNVINKSLAVNYTINTLILNGFKKTMKDIDVQNDADLRLYFRSLVNDAIYTMKRNKIPIKK